MPIRQFFTDNDLVNFFKYIFTEWIGVSTSLLDCIDIVWRVLKFVYKHAANYILNTLRGIKYTFLGQCFLVDRNMKFIQSEINDIPSAFETFFNNDQLTLESRHVESHKMKNYIHNLKLSLLETKQKREPTPLMDVFLPQNLVYDYEVLKNVNPVNYNGDKVFCQLSVNNERVDSYHRSHPICGSES